MPFLRKNHNNEEDIMLIIAERINATRGSIKDAILSKDAELIKKEARAQDEAGADYIDVNSGADPSGEKEYMEWLVEVVQDATEKPLCIDSASPEVIEAGIRGHRNGRPMINSITMETGKHEAILPMVKEHNALLVALAMDDRGIPKTPDDRLEVVQKIVEAVGKHDIPLSDVYIDPLIMALSADSTSGTLVMELIQKVKSRWPDLMTTCGLSNISFGLPLRHLVNRTFVAMLMACGMDSAIVDPTDKKMMTTIYAAEALRGRDEFCMNYLKAFRAKKLVE
jgi:cobalamin-dependent methionine synthase I